MKENFLLSILVPLSTFQKQVSSLLQVIIVHHTSLSLIIIAVTESDGTQATTTTQTPSTNQVSEAHTISSGVQAGIAVGTIVGLGIVIVIALVIVMVLIWKYKPSFITRY